MDPNTAAVATAVTTSIAKDVYKDALSPALQQFGAFGEDLLKTARFVLLPLQFGAAAQDRLARFLSNSVLTVPEARRLSPPTQLLGPIVEGIRYEPENSMIDKMFAELLSSAIDKDRMSDAHPTFPLLIRQMSPDEAILIKELATGDINRFIIRTTANLSTFEQDGEIISPIPEEISFPANMLMYFEHLESLGLVTETQIEQGTVEAEESFSARIAIRLTRLGRMFVRAVGLAQ